MGNLFHKVAISSIALFFSITLFAQTTTITGNVRNSNTKEGVPAVSITLKGSSAGTFTDDKGNFKLTTSQKAPFVLVITSIGFEFQEVQVSNPSQPVQVDAKPTSSLGAEVVISASRVPERILESPVSIERVGQAAIRNSPATSYFDIIKNLKGVDFTSSSLTFTGIITRRFLCTIWIWRYERNFINYQ